MSAEEMSKLRLSQNYPLMLDERTLGIMAAILYTQTAKNFEEAADQAFRIFQKVRIRLGTQEKEPG